MKSRQAIDSFLGAGLILVCFYLINLFVVNIFALNFSTDGINSTVYMILFLIGSGVFLIFSRPTGSFSLKIAWSIFGLGSILVVVPNSVTTVFMCGLGLVALIPLLVTFARKYSFALASSVYITVFTLFDGISIFNSIFGQVVYICFIFILVVLGILLKHKQAQTDRYLRIYPLIFLSVLFLAVPHTISAWTYPGLYNWLAFLSHTTYTYLLRVFSLIGIFAAVLIGEKQILNKPRMDEAETNDKRVKRLLKRLPPLNVEYKLKYAYVLAFSFLFLIAVLDLVFLYILPLLTFPVALFTSVLLSFTGIRNKPSRVFWLKFLGIQFIVLLILLFHLLAGNWRFAPSYLQAVVRGLAGVYLYMLAILFVVIQPIWRIKK